MSTCMTADVCTAGDSAATLNLGHVRCVNYKCQCVGPCLLFKAPSVCFLHAQRQCVSSMPSTAIRFSSGFSGLGALRASSCPAAAGAPPRPSARSLCPYLWQKTYHFLSQGNKDYGAKQLDAALRNKPSSCPARCAVPLVPSGI